MLERKTTKSLSVAFPFRRKGHGRCEQVEVSFDVNDVECGRPNHKKEYDVEGGDHH